ncbi:VOC family protein [Pedobacter endophyticus]|uniref:VOC family protein n=1 Tax=Pedobacter endophyticus TaxID=2789740 RepID=A0A7S9L1F1_9SPHI|nr:VOC family protein [Pedobacter endophyticus]QPH40663.1 VOC family protein [Pedobacter endophyticus]
MKKTLLIVLIVTASFISGFAFKALIGGDNLTEPKLKRVTGIGGIFFKCKDPKRIMEWYRTHLGLNTSAYGATFEWFESADSTTKAQTQWAPFLERTKYFEPSTKDFMINYRVDNLKALIAELKKENVTIVDSVSTYDYGKFVHIMDVEGNKIELWEPKK